MLKFMKYEIKGTYKYILGVLALVLTLTTALHWYGYRGNSTISSLGNIFILLSVLILFGTGLTTFFYIVGSFRKELYEDRGYLTFTLPLTGNQIVGSKLLVALMWFIILGIGIAAHNFLMLLIFNVFDTQRWTIIKEVFAQIKEIIAVREIFFSIIISIFSIISMLVLIYFSMAIGRVTFRNKKIGGLWFILFIIITILLSYTQFKISESIPYYFDLGRFEFNKLRSINDAYINEMLIESTDNGFSADVNLSILNMNIGASIFNILTAVGLFLGTGYLIEKRIDL